MFKDRSNLRNSDSIKIVDEKKCYQKIKLIGKGTFGKVFLVVDKKTKKEYALKEVVQDLKYKNRELAIISHLHHPNIIEMKDYFFKSQQNECILHIIMDNMDTSLLAMLREQRKTKQPISLVCRKLIAFQLFKALYYLKSNYICHRDLKPANILLNLENSQLKICDFGSAKIIKVKQNNVSYICSRYYRAPQLILSSSTYGPEIDMWSAGCILVELLTLEPLFPGDSSLEQLIEIIKILGMPKQNDIAVFSQQNSQISLPSIKGSDLGKILSRYKPEKLELDLIKSILVYDIKARLNPYQALMHHFFEDLMSFKEAQKLSHLMDFECLRNKGNQKEINHLKQLHQSWRQKYNNDNEDEGEGEKQTAVSISKVDDL